MAGNTASRQADPKRRIIVFAALTASLAVTAGFLYLLSPPPVKTQVQGTIALEEPIERISVKMKAPVRRSWKAIYVHQSKTTYADASNGDELTDHFVIGNGSGAADGALMVGYRWRQQQSAAAPPGASAIDPNWVSICLVGDLDRNPPTAAQMQRLGELVNSLQTSHGVPADRLYTIDHTSAAGAGKLFSSAELRRHLQ